MIILLDEYDTPMQEVYVHGYWEELADFIKGLFHSAFKTNPFLDRAVMTGITRVSRESIFSDLNNLEIYGLSEQREKVRDWYDGFVFGRQSSRVKIVMEDLLKGGKLCTEIDEQVVFDQLD